MEIRYEELFDHLHTTLPHQPCDHTLRHTAAFAKQHGLCFVALAQLLEDYGGHCDCEVMLNVSVMQGIDADELIGQESFTTPREYAIEHGLFCHNLVNGVPADWWQVNTAKQAGVSDIQFLVSCGPDDSCAFPDVAKALMVMTSSGDCDS